LDEKQWLNATDPEPMLGFLRGSGSPRKLRLFACALCRVLWDLLSDPRSRAAVEVAERFADGAATGEELAAARAGARKARGPADLPSGVARQVTETAAEAAAVVAWEAAEGVAEGMAEATWRAANMWQGNKTWKATRRLEAGFLGEIVGNPFRPLAPRVFPAHVLGLARSIYDAFPDVSADYPILADALEELGEVEAAAHCRQDVHAKGCYVVDWVLGKE
jgi:hypothetical protein